VSPQPALPRHPLRLADLPNRKPTEAVLTPTTAERAALAEALGITAIKKLTFQARLTPIGRTDWTLDGRLGATVVQDCVVTFAPVTTRIDEDVRRTYMQDLPDPDPGESEMPEDDTVDPLPAVLDLGDVMAEALALALPAFPRAPDAPPLEVSVTEPGKAPMTDADARPFAGLAALRDKLGDDGSDPA
jgi:uncharacterized metal-binding protein YceD (DUF177 family)